LVLGLFLTALIVTANAALSAQSGVPARRLSTENFFDVVQNDVQRSTQSGLDVAQLRTDAVSLGRDGIRNQLNRIVSATDAVLREVRDVNVPSNLRDARDLLVATLDLRAKAAVDLRQAFAEALGVPPAGTAVAALADVGDGMKAADRVYRLFQSTLPAGLASIPDSRWVADQAAWTPMELTIFVNTLRASTSLAPVHDVRVVMVATNPAPVGQQLNVEVLPVARNLGVEFVVADEGNEPERQLTVSVSINPAVDGIGASARDFIDLVPGQKRTVDLGNLHPVANTATVLTVHIQAAPGQTGLPDTQQTLNFIMR
jgi:hypothetical protein